MKKIYDLWEHLTPPLRGKINLLKILLVIILVSALNVRTLTAGSSGTPVSSATEDQQNAITGTITDAATKEPMPGVNIQVKGTTVGAITDMNGKFSIPSVDRNATLIISFIGFVTQEIPLGGKLVINVALVTEAQSLSEVVVTGYSAVKKQSLTGAISTINKAEIVSTRTNSVASMVQGKIPGLLIRKRTGEPGTFNSYINVRGFSGAPLLVIDGVVRDNMSDFERLNPQDIESISVLKDASAAIYGMNSDNGVLIVTTKIGTKGAVKINVNSTYSLKVPTVQGFQNTVDAYTFRVMKNEMLRNYRQVEQYSAAELAKWQTGTEPGYTDYDWYSGLQANSVGAWNHNISITGGNDIITHYTSFGFMNDMGIYRDNRTLRYKKYNLRTAFDAKLAEGLTFSVKVAGKIDNSLTPPQSYYWIFKQMLVSDRGTGPYTLATLNSPVKHYSVVPSENINVFAKTDPNADGYVRAINYQYQLSGELKYDVPFIKGLTLDVLGAYDGNLAVNTTFRGSFILYDYRTDAPGSPTQATIDERMINFIRTDIQGKISYKNSFSGVHNINALLVSEVRQLNTKDVGGHRQYDQIYTHDLIDQASTTNQTTRGGLTQEAYLSYIGKFNYDYKGKYLAEFSFREDGSYRYAPSQRWAFFPYGSVGWRISEESFIKNSLPVISNLKIRASYGIMGSDAGNAFQYVPGYSLSAIRQGAVLNPGVLTLGMIPPGVINENLSWIQAKTTDIGMDLSLWKGKLGVVFDVFQKDRTGLLATRATSVPNTFGASFPQENLNSDQVKGLELEVSHRGQVRDINYTVSANVTYSRTFLQHQEMAAYQSTWDQWKNGSDGNGRIQGRAWGYTKDGTYTDIKQYQTAPLLGGTLGNSYCLPGDQIVRDVNGDGRINGDDQLPKYWAQDVNPPLQYGANLSASWKGFDLNMLFQGASLFTLTMNAGDTWGYKTYPSAWDFWLDRWQQADVSVNPYDPAAVWIPGKYAPLQSSWTGTNQGVNTDQWIWPATYLRIKNLDLGYSLPNRLTKQFFVQDLRLSFGIVNLATFCKKDLKRFDPEKESGAYNAELTYPLLREYNLTLSVTF
jgi:TonB-linked SusC/RagA family outer membrane protein